MIYLMHILNLAYVAFGKNKYLFERVQRIFITVYLVINTGYNLPCKNIGIFENPWADASIYKIEESAES